MNTIEKIKNRTKKTNVRVYLNEEIEEFKEQMYQRVVIGEWKKIKEILEKHKIKNYRVETLCVNSALDLLDSKELSVRIEYGAIVRENVEIGKGAVLLMGCIVNTGCFIGENTMIDMGAVIGGHVIVKENCHIGANAVLAGTIEPYCEKGVCIEKDCFIGAGAVVLEGVHIGQNTIIGANSLVLEDIPSHSVAVGIPAKVIKKNEYGTLIVPDLRIIQK